MNAVARPPLRYLGGKWRIAPWVISHFPPHTIYVEPFGGGGSVLLRKVPATTEIYNDLDGEVVNFFRVLQSPQDAAELAKRVELTPYARDLYENWCYEEGGSSVDRAHRMLVRSFMGMSSKGIFNRSGFDVRINPDGCVSRLSALRHAPAAVREAADRLVGVIIENCDASRLLDRCDRSDTLIYCDPPYVLSERSSTKYRHEMTDADHERLAEVLHASKAMVILSGYHSKLYDRIYRNWARDELLVHADSGGPNRGDRGRIEVLWMNDTCAKQQPQSRLFA